MKRRFSLLISLLVLTVTLFACGTGSSGGGDNNGGSGSDAPAKTGDFIFGGETVTAVISNNTDKKLTYDLITEMSNTIYLLTDSYPGTYPEYKDVTWDAEIVIGETDRDITEKAFDHLNKMIKREIRSSADEDAAEKDTVGYTVYSDGKSVAVVWSDWRLEEAALRYFIDNYVIASTLALDEGYAKSSVFSLDEFLYERGEGIKAEAWAELAAALPEEYSEDIIFELKELYSLYGVEMVSWLANLADPETGGWYHANSARDNLGFLPNIESTLVAVYFTQQTGMAEMRNNDWRNLVPKSMQKNMGEWIYSLQDPDGYFYHPQWDKAFITANGLTSRIARDRTSALNLLNALGVKSKYAGYSLSDAPLLGSLSTGSVIAVSKAVAVVDKSESFWQYKSVENFKIYLAELDETLAKCEPAAFAKNFYSYGNQFQSTVGYMDGKPNSGEANPAEAIARENEIRALLEEFFAKHQNPETGVWSEVLLYDATNGLHKIASVCNSLGIRMNYTDEMVETVFAILNFDVEKNPAQNGVDIYNAWSCFSYIFKNVRNCGDGTALERLEQCDIVKDRVFAAAPELIRNTTDHMRGFRQADGSFGYNRYGSASSDQGCPSAVKNTAEGDVNGNQIASLAIIQHIMAAFELDEYEVPMFTEREANIFENILLDLGPVIKNDILEATVYDFEDDEPGECPSYVSSLLDSGRNPIDGTLAAVKELEDRNRVFEYIGKNRGDDSNGRNYNIGIGVTASSVSPNVGIFEMDLMFVGAECSTNYAIAQFYIRDSGSPVVEFTFRKTPSGDIDVHNNKGVRIGNVGKADKWMHFSVEYYWEEGVYKFYSEGVFIGSGSDTYNDKPHSAPYNLTFATPSQMDCHFYMDNLIATRGEKEYVKETVPAKVETFESKYTVTDKTVASGGTANDITFESGLSLIYPADKTNAAGSRVEVVEEGNNRFLRIVSPKRKNTNDRSYTLSTGRQSMEKDANAVVYEARLRFSEECGAGTVLQVQLRDSKSYAQYNLDNTKEYVGFGGVRLGYFGDWIDLRLVQFVEEGRIYVYSKGENDTKYFYRGILGVCHTGSVTDKDPANLTMLNSISLTVYNDYGNAIVDFDNISLYDAVLEYEDLSLATPAPISKS